MSLLTAIADKARTSRRHIVLPEGDDVRVMQAAAALREDGIAEISLVGARDSLEALSASHGIDLAGVDIVDPADEERRERCAAVIHEARRHRNVSLEDARQMALDRLMLGTAMVRAGMVDGMVAGAAHPTAEVVRSALQLVGMNPGSRIVSSFFLMEHALPHQAIQGTALYADCAMVIEPDPEELASIAMDTADNARNLAGIEPRVALLSFSTAGSAEHGHIDRVRAAGALVAERRPDIEIMTEVQFDAAIIPEILQRKAPGIGVPAPANVFVFPDLQSANIGYKIAQRIGGVQATGPVLQGLRLPVNDLSRGCSVEDIFNLVAVTAVQSIAGECD
ncbi:MAG: phosphate acetyltransferase [Gammaproteobacteria bacterium]|nr:phosphate acetyltransferase [Gammaproteobacteria bacterium]